MTENAVNQKKLKRFLHFAPRGRSGLIALLTLMLLSSSVPSILVLLLLLLSYLILQCTESKPVTVPLRKLPESPLCGDCAEAGAC